LRAEMGQRIAAVAGGCATLQELVDRAGPRRDELRALAEVGALNAFGLTRRSALWQVEQAARPRGPLLRDTDEAEAPSPLAEMTLPERMQSDLLGTGVTLGPHPMALYREGLRARGVLRAVELSGLGHGQRVHVAGAVICRQRPGTAKGFLFLTLEDETGLVNVIVRPDLFAARHGVIVGHGVLEIEGVLQAEEGITVRALEVRSLGAASIAPPSRDFH
jgi:error-prone DNA polymerase